MSERPEQRPEGRLIATAQKRPRISNREAAARADMSEGHWRAIVSGSRSMGKDLWVPVRAPADTLARMAQVVGVTPEQLIEANREDAAEELRNLLSDEHAPTPAGMDPDEARIWAIDELSDDEKEILAGYLRAKKRAIAQAEADARRRGA